MGLAHTLGKISSLLCLANLTVSGALDRLRTMDHQSFACPIPRIH